jgi:hypothetical protein
VPRAPATRAGNARRQRAPAAARAALEGGRTSRAALRHGRALAVPLVVMKSASTTAATATGIASGWVPAKRLQNERLRGH